MIEQSVVIHRPLFDVFDYLMDVERLWEWAPYFLDTEILDKDDKGWPKRFTARIGLIWDFSYETEVALSDVRRGRSISYRSAEPPQVATYTVDPAPSGTILTARHNPWVTLGLTALQGPLTIFGTDYLSEALSNVKLTLEARTSSSRPVVFLSYRRQTAEYIAGRIVETISREFGEESVFRDLVTISAGQNADEAVKAGLEACAAVIVLVDRKWLENFDSRRETDEHDYVLAEIEAGLEAKKLVIPVALHDVPIDEVRARLPSEIQELSAIQWQQLRYDPDFTWDMDRIVKAIWDEVRNSRSRDADESRRLAPGRRDQSAGTDLVSVVMKSWFDVYRRVLRAP